MQSVSKSLCNSRSLNRWLQAVALLVMAVTIFSTAAHAQYSPPTSGLVSWWRGDGNASDSADGNNGTALNGAGYTAGVLGSAFSFDGIDDHVRVANNANLQITSAITVGAWIYKRTTGSFDEIISKWDATPFGQRSYTMSVNPDGRAYFSLSTIGLVTDASAYTTSLMPLNTWTHLAGTYDGSSVSIYVNGVLNSQSAYTGGIFSGSDDLSIGGVAGAVGVGSGISFFDGRIDEALIYNRALSGSEIFTLATVPEPSSLALCFIGLLGARWFKRP